ncbi:MAG TPA: hypothetical protein VG735_06405 [Caulobacterales bacterium]|jgi:hypothetical protein|nr:hypothetical protein [Caulobacterales bacterium]
MRLKTPEQTVATSYDEPHEVIGRFVVLCSTLEYRQSQLLSRYFTPGSRVKFLSNVIHSIPAELKSEIIAERLSLYHPKGKELPAHVEQVGAVLARRDLAVHGVLTAVAGGYALKNLAAHPIRHNGEILDELLVSEIPKWSQEAIRLTGETMRLAKLSEEQAARV